MKPCSADNKYIDIEEIKSDLMESPNTISKQRN